MGKGTKYHSVCPLVVIGTLPPPLSPASVPLPPEPGGGGHTGLRARGWGNPNSHDWRKSLALCLLCGLKTREKLIPNPDPGVETKCKNS
jgi:hypothetical protein